MLPRVSYTRCRPTHPIPVQCWASIAAHSWRGRRKCQTGIPSTQPIAGSIPTNRLRRWPNTTHGVCCILSGINPEENVLFTKCRPNVLVAGPTVKQHWVIVPSLLGLRITMRVTLFFSRPQIRNITSQITRYRQITMTI